MAMLEAMLEVVSRFPELMFGHDCLTLVSL